MTSGTEKKEPWVKVTIKSNGEVTVVGEGWNNAIELITALNTGSVAVQQQLTNNSKIMIPGIQFPRQGPIGRT